MATQYNRTGYQAQMDIIFADNTNGNIDAADIRNATKDLAESAGILTAVNVFTEDNVFGEIDHVQVFGSTGVPGYADTNEDQPTIHVFCDDYHAIRIENTDNVDADEDNWVIGQKDTGEFALHRIADESGTHVDYEIMTVDENDVVRFSGFGLGTSTEYTIASNAITPKGSRISIDTEGDAASDDLDTITATNYLEGDILIIKTENNSRVITVKDGTGNIQVNGDFVMDNIRHRLFLEFAGTNWVELSRAEAT